MLKGKAEALDPACLPGRQPSWKILRLSQATPGKADDSSKPSPGSAEHKKQFASHRPPQTFLGDRGPDSPSKLLHYKSFCNEHLGSGFSLCYCNGKPPGWEFMKIGRLKPGVAAHSWNPDALEEETGGSLVQGHPWLPSTAVASLKCRKNNLRQEERGLGQGDGPAGQGTCYRA